MPESVSVARAWDAAERYLTMEEFCVALRDPMYTPIINCMNWEVKKALVLFFLFILTSKKKVL